MSDVVLSRRPLTASARDQALFVDPPELDLVVGAVRIGTNVFVSGAPGAGKTTLARRLEADDLAVVVVQAEREPSPAGLIAGIAAAVSDTGVQAVEGLRDASGTESDVGVIGDALTAGSPVRVVVVDGASNDQVAVVFGRYRDALWELPVSWVVTSRSAVPEPPADAFFDRVVQLDPWSPDKLLELARRRSPDTCDAGFGVVVEAIAPATPLAGLLALQEFVLSPDADALVEGLRREQDLVGELPERLRSLYQALGALGSVSASDPELLRAVGVSRSRATHGLKELEERDLAHARRDGKKMLYSLRQDAIAGLAR